MQKRLGQFVRLLFALVVAFGAFAPIGVNAQPPIEPGIGPVIAEAKIDDRVRLRSGSDGVDAGVGVTVERKRVRVRAFNMALIF